MISSEALSSGLSVFDDRYLGPAQPIQTDYSKILRLKRPGRYGGGYKPPKPLPPVIISPGPIIGGPAKPVSNTPYLSGSLVSPGIAKLNWNAMPGAVGYKLRRDGTVSDRGNITSDYISNLTNGTTYFDVASYDASGKVSEFSNVVPITVTGVAAPTNPNPTQVIFEPVDDLIFGFPSTYVYIGGAAIGVAVLLYMMSGKK